MNGIYFLFCLILSFLSVNSVAVKDAHVIWHAPFYSGGGYCSEAMSIVESLIAANISVTIVHHGDSINQEYLKGLPEPDLQLLRTYANNRKKQKRRGRGFIISICHSEPGAWNAPLPQYHTNPCPSPNSDYHIGRTMFETDRIPSGWLQRLNYMNEIWVPTDFSFNTFLRAGMSSNKLRVVGEPINTALYSPDNAIARDDTLFDELRRKSQSAFVFLFVGKWERRKGIELLVQSYFEEFRAGDNALLVILTNAYHSTEDFESDIYRITQGFGYSINDDSPAYILMRGLPQRLMVSMYSFADVLVIPSYGEGWGRPHVEAMSMEIPIIATNWSGPTEYLSNNNGYPIPYDLVESKDWKGHFWAQPRMQDLKRLLRHAIENPKEVKEKGVIARQTIVERYSIEAMAKDLQHHILEIRNLARDLGEL